MLWKLGSDLITADDLILGNVHIRRNQGVLVLALGTVPDKDDSDRDSRHDLSLLLLDQVCLNGKQIFGSSRVHAVHGVDFLQIKLLFIVLVIPLFGATCYFLCN